MSFDPVPWFIGGGAQHSPEVARLLAYAATSGAEGIVEAGDLKVQPLAVPGGAVRVAPGAALIRNRATGGAQQTYVARLPQEDTVAIAPTGSSGGRSDLIVARIEDPYMAGEPWQDPADPTVGPYVFTRVISNVPSTTKTAAELGLGHSMIALARIDLPASTGTVQAAHIVDLRNVAQPRRSTEAWVNRPTQMWQASSSAGWQDWITFTNNTLIPSWAGRAVIRFAASGLVIRTAAWSGKVRVAITTSAGTFATEGIGVTEDATGGDYRFSIPFGDLISVPANHAGLMASVKVQTYHESGSGLLQVNTSSTASADITYIQSPR